MAKGQKRSQREAKKPKKNPAVVAETAASFPLKMPAGAPAKKKR